MLVRILILLVQVRVFIYIVLNLFKQNRMSWLIKLSVLSNRHVGLCCFFLLFFLYFLFFLSRLLFMGIVFHGSGLGFLFRNRISDSGLLIGKVYNRWVSRSYCVEIVYHDYFWKSMPSKKSIADSSHILWNVYVLYGWIQWHLNFILVCSM